MQSGMHVYRPVLPGPVPPLFPGDTQLPHSQDRRSHCQLTVLCNKQVSLPTNSPVEQTGGEQELRPV